MVGRVELVAAGGGIVEGLGGGRVGFEDEVGVVVDAEIELATEALVAGSEVGGRESCTSPRRQVEVDEADTS